MKDLTAWVPGIRTGYLIFILFVHMLWVTPASAQRVAVLYPEIREPYLHIFLNIAEGVSAASPQPVEYYPLARNFKTTTLNQWIEKRDVDIVIALGKRSFKALPKLPDNIVQVTGAAMLNPKDGDHSGISLVPSPTKLFKKLQHITPGIAAIHVIYPMNHNSWLREQAQEAADTLGIELKPKIAKNIHDTAELYKSVLNTMDSKTQALWLPHTGSVIDRALMQQILAIAWQRNLVVFSSSFSDVKRGVLFSLYPDNFEMGKALAHMAFSQKAESRPTPIITLVDTLFTAVNLRTAEHLGLHFSKKEKQSFDFMYPPPN